jgi:hypothetical protein
LVALAPHVILAAGTLSVAALKRETQTIPIVFNSVSDPVGAGFVASLARPSVAAERVPIFRDPSSLYGAAYCSRFRVGDGCGNCIVTC